MPTNFGALLKKFRKDADYGLREFAEMVGEAPSNLSNIESGARAPWRDSKVLASIADALKLKTGSMDWDMFFLSANQYRILPPDVEPMLERPLIPQLLRTVNEMRLSDDDLKKLIDKLRGKKKKEPDK